VEQHADRAFRGTLFLFLACTDVVIIAPGPRIDVGMVSMLKSLSAKRQRIVHELKRLHSPPPPPPRGSRGRRAAPTLQPGDVTPTLTVLLPIPSAEAESEVAEREAVRQRVEEQLRRAFDRAGLGGGRPGALFSFSADGGGGGGGGGGDDSRPLVIVCDTLNDTDPAEDILNVADEVRSGKEFCPTPTCSPR
jgi:hypothetical protein